MIWQEVELFRRSDLKLAALLGAHPLCELHDQTLADQITSPLAYLRYDSSTTAVWIRGFSPLTVASGGNGTHRVSVSERTWVALGLGDKHGPLVAAFGHAESSRVRVATALAHDLPGANEVFVDPNSPHAGNWVLVTPAVAAAEMSLSNRTFQWAHVRTAPACATPRRDCRKSEVRISMHLRVLLGDTGQEETEAHHTIILVEPKPPIQPETKPAQTFVTLANVDFSIFNQRSSSQWKFFRAVGRVTARLWRNARWTPEFLLSAILGAPDVSLRTIEARIGDDTEGIVRMPRDLLFVLGIEEGEDVLVGWGARSVAARALAWEELSDGVGAFQKTTDTPIAADVAGDSLELSVSVPAPMRSALAIPRDTVVSVRRRLLPLVVKRLNQLTIPFGAMLFAGLATSLPKVALVATTAVVIVLAFAPLRRKGVSKRLFRQ